MKAQQERGRPHSDAYRSSSRGEGGLIPPPPIIPSSFGRRPREDQSQAAWGMRPMEERSGDGVAKYENDSLHLGKL
ncbi:hypothetical protein JTE90_004701 [Oedothorax gibbosus]|uniref:Uncharacterized protein n=1 Tax=Oedothorax gibbosus TaxID=931172 RepID=A0AAV6UAU4_9ARAC|nr:hypothetical protein JTE90_004701 [Oedothorax gibbosus]